MVENAGNLSKQSSDILGSIGNLNVQKLFNSKSKALLVRHHRNVVQSIKVRQGLEIGLVLDQLLGTSVQQTDMGIGTNDLLAIQLENQTQHTVGGGMLRTKVDSIVTNLAVFDRILARLLGGTGDLGAGAVRVIGIGKVGVDGDEPCAHGLRSGIFSKRC